MADKYIIEKDQKGVPLVRDSLEGKTVIYTEGLCSASLDDPKRPREPARYLAEVVQPRIDVEELDDGTRTQYDCRVIRFHDATTEGNSLLVRLGYSIFPDSRAQFKLPLEEILKLRTAGERDFQDPHAYLERATGVSGLVLSKEGSIILGERTIKDEYEGQLNAVNGNPSFSKDLNAVDFRKDVAREVTEEFGLSSRDMQNIILAGVYGNKEMAGADLDFAHLVFTSKPREYFTSGAWQQQVAEQEHKTLVAITTFKEVEKLREEGILPNGKKVPGFVYSTLAALKMIKPLDMQR